MADDQTEAATDGEAMLAELEAHILTARDALKESIRLQGEYASEIERLEAENKAMRECIDAAEMAKSRIDAFADKANAGEIHHSARELSRAVWAAFTEFETARAALQGKAKP